MAIRCVSSLTLFLALVVVFAARLREPPNRRNSFPEL